MRGDASDTTGPGEQRSGGATVERAVLVVDLVESVALMLRDEASVITRWRQFSDVVRHELLPPDGTGRVVKSLGDGMLLVFDDARTAAALSWQLHERMAQINAGCRDDTRMHLRVGCTFTPLVEDEFDVYGVGVNLAARLAALGDPGQTVAAASFCDRLTPGVDAETEDLGEHYLKNIEAPVRAFRIRRCGQSAAGGWTWAPERPVADTLPTLAVLPFGTHGAGADWQEAGEMLAEDLTATLSRSPAWRVTSRLSAACFAGRAQDMADIAARLGVRYVVSGKVHLLGTTARVYAELCDAPAGVLLWAHTWQVAAGELIAGGDLLQRLQQAVGRTLIAHELDAMRGRPLSALHERSLLLQAITGMHRMSRSDSERALAALEHVATRHPRHASAFAWQAKWHLIQLAQAWSADPERTATSCRNATQRALHCDPNDALALALDGHAQAFIRRDLDLAARQLDAAVQADPNQSLAWLFRSSVHAHRNEGPAAMEAIGRADAMSPLDPMRYFFDSFAAMAALADGQAERAWQLARRSVSLNARHLSSWLLLTLAAAEAGRMDDARTAAAQILALRPDARVSRFVAQHPGSDATLVEHQAEALLAAGLPR
ncbi:MAG: hypothetical protein WAQ05_15455 [Rubrivivax sp.]